MENNKALIAVVNNLQIEDHSGEKSDAEQFEVLVSFIDDLIRNDFNRLLSILYRVDISEQKLKQKLAENKETTVRSAEIIAQLLIDREEEKIISRAKYRQEK
ncbi:hypothetical protein Q73A0000_01955 [Kaistella flava (ex Peng et al. 2021)]|uniref:Uncharacterized protein n=1 Tax=Kaistella flava (ex Peng et al. 2021) TaxID=2038776 RepID=A0A7M2Y532_9FLAO|nr:hypothetical protein [Kaistella flava (ex Peng et al. 2021)]QOW09206.1 hypothetical protein Q73A0000_01955 [Kaistella flava (ex Peng et al. 2021)]